MSDLKIDLFSCGADNFGILVNDPKTGLVAAIDTPDSDIISRQLANNNWKLTHIFNTHHHFDHVPGNESLKLQTGCTIMGASKDAKRIPGIDVRLVEGEIFSFGDHQVKLIETPGHTSGSVCFYLPADKLLFTGDTLFSMGCGRLFEGTAAQMWASLQKIMALPDDTKIYCGHEYSLTNGEFALELEPENAALQERMTKVRKLRRKRRPTLPVTLAMEKATNPFLRPHSAEIQKYFGLQGGEPAKVFAAIRELRNNF